MKWFKHMTDAHRDDKLVEIHNKWGMWGLGVYWDLVSRVAEQYKDGKPPVVKLNVQELCQFFGAKRNKLRSFLDHSAIIRLMIVRPKPLQNFGIENIIEIEIPNIVNIKDNYSRNLQVTDKQLTSNLQATCKQEVEVEVEVDKKKKKKKKKRNPPTPLPCPDFLIPILKAIATTRQTGKIADNVRESIIKKILWYIERQGEDEVKAGCQIYLDKNYAADGKPEQYLYGIIRGNPESYAPKKVDQRDTQRERQLKESRERGRR